MREDEEGQDEEGNEERFVELEENLHYIIKP